MKAILLILAALTFTTSARANCLSNTAGLQQAYDSQQLAIALDDLNGFSYIRNQLTEWQSQGNTICATGVALEKNIYQYLRWFIQIEVRDQYGELKALVPVLFQTASVQAHDNTGPKPWAVMPYADTKAILGQMKFQAQETLDKFPQPGAADFKAMVRSQAWAQAFDESSFSVTPLAKDLYMIGWLAQVQGTGGDFFTRQYAPKVVLLHYLGNGGVEIDHSHSGYREMLAPLDTLLNSIHVSNETVERQELVKRFSELGR